MGTTTFLASHVPMPWGNVDTDVFAAWGQWAGGIGSIAAVAVALWVLVRDRRLMAAQRAEREAERAEAEHQLRIARARTVLASRADVMSDFRPSRPPRETTGVRVVNHSAGPVLEVILEGVTLTDVNGTVHTDWSAGRPDNRIHGVHLLAEVLGPEEAAELPSLDFGALSAYPDAELRAGKVTVTFTFLDPEGYRWRRSGNAAPVQIREDEVRRPTVA